MTSVQNRDRDGRIPLHQAAVHGKLTDVKQMIAAGDDVNATDKEGFTPLHMASQQGHADVAKALLDAGANVDAKDAWGNTPLWRAVFAYSSTRDGSLIRLLLERGADPHSTNVAGKSPREMALTLDKPGIREFFP